MTNYDEPLWLEWVKWIGIILAIIILFIFLATAMVREMSERKAELKAEETYPHIDPSLSNQVDIKGRITINNTESILINSSFSEGYSIFGLSYVNVTGGNDD